MYHNIAKPWKLELNRELLAFKLKPAKTWLLLLKLQIVKQQLSKNQIFNNKQLDQWNWQEITRPSVDNKTKWLNKNNKLWNQNLMKQIAKQTIKNVKIRRVKPK